MDSKWNWECITKKKKKKVIIIQPHFSIHRSICPEATSWRRTSRHPPRPRRRMEVLENSLLKKSSQAQVNPSTVLPPPCFSAGTVYKVTPTCLSTLPPTSHGTQRKFVINSAHAVTTALVGSVSRSRSSKCALQTRTRATRESRGRRDQTKKDH